jgi:hypothetical protein
MWVSEQASELASVLALALALVLERDSEPALALARMSALAQVLVSVAL